MWPKAIAQLVELAPHIARLLPSADTYLRSKASGDDATRTAVDKLGADLRAEMGLMTAAHESLYRQLDEQTEKLAAMTDDMAAARAAAESAEERATGLERRVATSSALLAIVLPINVILLALTILLLVRH